MSRGNRPSTGAWRLFVAVLCFGGSVYLVGDVVARLAPLLPPERVGPLAPAEIVRLSSVARLVWGMGHLLAGAFFLSGARGGRETVDVVFRATLATFLLVLALRLPLASWWGARALARSRYLLPTVVLLVGALLFAVLRRRPPPAPEGWRRPPRVVSPGIIAAGIAGKLAAAALLLTMVGESVIDLRLVHQLNYVPDHAAVGELGRALVLGTLLLAAPMALAYAVMRRVYFSLLVVGAGFGLIVTADVIKLGYLRAPLEVLDVYYLFELRTVLTGFVAPLLLVAIGGGLLAAGVGAVLCLRGETPVGGLWTRLAAGGFFLGVVAASVPYARHDAARPEAPWAALKTTLNRGLCFDLACGLAEAVPAAPPGYYDTAVVRILAARPPTEPARRDEEEAPASVILLLVESLTDPRDYGFTLSADPLARLHELEATARTGRTLSPAFGSGSANAEFELLTGMSMAFLPPGSIPYRQYLRREAPSLARVLRAHGRQPRAIIVDPPWYFSREAALPHLGFEEITWLDARPGVERDVTGRFASDGAVIDALVALDNEAEPFFAFAFTNASHGPYDVARFGPDAIRVLDPPTPRVAREFGGYANALAATDEAVGRLVDHYAMSERPVLLVVLGDHYPPFTGPDGVYESSAPFRGCEAEGQRRRHAVPVWMWTNRGELDRTPFSTSDNFLGLLVLETLRIEPDPFLGVVDGVRAKYRAFSRILESVDGELGGFHAPRARREAAVRSYELLQYDLLLGERYYYETVGR